MRQEQRDQREDAAEHEEAALRARADGLLGLALDDRLVEAPVCGQGRGLWRGQGHTSKGVSAAAPRNLKSWALATLETNAPRTPDAAAALAPPRPGGGRREAASRDRQARGRADRQGQGHGQRAFTRA